MGVKHCYALLKIVQINFFKRELSILNKIGHKDGHFWNSCIDLYKLKLYHLKSTTRLNEFQRDWRPMSQGFFSLALPVTQQLTPINERPFTPSPLPSPRQCHSPTSFPSGFIEKAKDVLQLCIMKRGTKASTTSIDNDVNNLCHYYSFLNEDEKSELLLHIAQTLSTNHRYVADLIKQMPCCDRGVGKSDLKEEIEAMTRWEDKLRQSLQPPYYWLATQISRLTNGVKFIVDMREDVLELLANQTLLRENQIELKAFDASLRDLLSLWFTVGLLDLQRITWESSCDILQKISEYEAVHPVRNWTDLKKRVGHYRRCFIFTHSCMPHEPLVVLHTYLTNEISNSMSKIVQQIPRNLSVDESSSKEGEHSSMITSAIFYSITSTQKGLKGIELGNYLIKRVVRELQAELPSLSQFSSLSPIPGFVNWLEGTLVRAQRGEFDLLSSTEIKSLQEELQVSTTSDLYAELKGLLKTNAWSREENLKTLLQLPFMRLCAFYLYLEKRRGYALDAVANFHLRNGAVMWRLNWNADRSPRGMDNSCGMMVNYRYFLDDCEKNSKNYLETSQVTASDSVIYLAKIADDIINKRQ